VDLVSRHPEATGVVVAKEVVDVRDLVLRYTDANDVAVAEEVVNARDLVLRYTEANDVVVAEEVVEVRVLFRHNGLRPGLPGRRTSNLPGEATDVAVVAFVARVDGDEGGAASQQRAVVDVQESHVASGLSSVTFDTSQSWI